MANIMTHTGDQLCTNLVLQLTLFPDILVHYNPNQSMLCLPQSVSPMAHNWWLWSKIICCTFAKTGSLTLQHPLRLWTEHYTTDYDWTWHICNTTFSLYNNSPRGWKLYWPNMLCHTYVWYTHHPIGTTAPIPATPVTPVIQLEYIEIKLPLNPIHPPIELPQHQMTNFICILTTQLPPGNNHCGTRYDPMQTYTPFTIK